MIAASRLCRGFMPDFLRAHGSERVAASRAQEQDFARDAGSRDDEAAPDVEPVSAHRKKIRCACPVHFAASGNSCVHCRCASRSSMIARTRPSTAATLYIQNARAITSIPVSIVVAMLGARVMLTDAPWCSVFHHCTEK